MPANNFTCEKCKAKFPTLNQALNHAQKEHGMTLKERDDERKLHRK